VVRGICGEVVVDGAIRGGGVRFAVLLGWVVELVVDGGQGEVGAEAWVEHGVAAREGEGEDVLEPGGVGSADAFCGMGGGGEEVRGEGVQFGPFGAEVEGGIAVGGGPEEGGAAG